METGFYSGFVSITGRPNVGKSTLLNALIGEKVAIVSNKPQTTRNRIQGVLTGEDFQAVFIDTPGIHGQKHKLDTYMQKSVTAALSGVDVILFLAEPTLKLLSKDKEIIEKWNNIGQPVFLLVNKIDKIEENRLLPIIEGYKNIFDFAEIIPISALTGNNLDELLRVIKKYLPMGIKYFPDDYITDMPERQIAAEIIREKALACLKEEIPHGIAIVVSSMHERGKIIDIEAVIYCEKTSHKGIIIGKSGEMLKKIGVEARADIERLLDAKVNLQTWVKIKDNWRDNDFLLRNFGFDLKKI